MRYQRLMPRINREDLTMALTNGGRRITLITICTLHRHIEVVPDRFYSLGRGRPQRLQFRELTAKTRGGCFWLPDLIAQHLELALARWSSHWLYFGETQPALNAFTCIHSLTHSQGFTKTTSTETLQTRYPTWCCGSQKWDSTTPRIPEGTGCSLSEVPRKCNWTCRSCQDKATGRPAAWKDPCTDPEMQ